MIARPTREQSLWNLQRASRIFQTHRLVRLYANLNPETLITASTELDMDGVDINITIQSKFSLVFIVLIEWYFCLTGYGWVGGFQTDI